jgi:hypothetical protein
MQLASSDLHLIGARQITLLQPAKTCLHHRRGSSRNDNTMARGYADNLQILVVKYIHGIA